MDVNTNKALAQSLRKIAQLVRAAHEEAETIKMVKCAKILIASNGLNQLAQILKGQI